MSDFQQPQPAQVNIPTAATYGGLNFDYSMMFEGGSGSGGPAAKADSGITALMQEYQQHRESDARSGKNQAEQIIEQSQKRIADINELMKPAPSTQPDGDSFMLKNHQIQKSTQNMEDELKTL